MANKTLLITLVSFGLLLSAAAGRCIADSSAETVRATEPDPIGLIAHYEFEGFAVDTSGFQPPANGTLFGNPAYVDGVFGRGIYLDGDGDYVDCGNASYFDITEQITVAAWIKVVEFDKKYQTIIAKGDNSWRLARVSDSNNIEFACNGTAATKWTGVGEIPWAVSTTTGVNDGKWHHIAGVFDGTQLYLYIDGVLEAAKRAAKSIDISSYNVFIGANAQVPGRQWNGLIDDVRIYNYALIQAEIVSIMGENEINLLSRFPATLYDIAKRYDGLEKIEEAKGVCQLILQQHPNSPSADGAQLYLARRNIMSNIKSKNYPEARAELDTLIADFNDHPDFAASLCAIAQSYEWPRKFEKAESLYERAAQLDPNDPYVKKAKFNWPKLHIFSLIKSEDYNDANVAIDKFTSDFDKHPAVPGVVYWFAKDFEAAKAYDRAKGMYRRVVRQYPKSSHAARALLQASKVDIFSLIESGDDAAVHMALDTLIADFNDHKDVPETVFEIGEQYYYKAFEDPKKCRKVKSKEPLHKAKDIWEMIVEQWPQSKSIGLKHAYYFSAVCYHRLGEYEKAITNYQKEVDDWPDYLYAWSAQSLIGNCYEKLRNSGVIPESEANPKIEQAYEAVIERYPDCSLVGHACLKLARLNFEKGRWAEAAMYFELFLQESHDCQRSSRVLRVVLYDLGRAYEKMGEFEQAAHLYGEFIMITDPNDPHVKRVEALLEELEGVEK
ncbi:MAG: tetratricopeptide repeat protein [Phycisphaerae bacterium]|nr:tetratricopeptide repeat protein [Phycisphaerae bacterium]NIW46985.1 tetratricopeptide repeat protein [Gammaproteobacteria bacterium]NIP52005.1 tetratricopeptide repeat protein [Phycisphaerae bacterium]NIS51101.1 tetratricopeptide repeat protein [Phycisphaerae bacterium]NIW98337.1 tetratricopeptide repeat protein [Phycisphaerae bacterium]